MEPIVTSGLTKRYGELFAVRDLDLTVRAGEVYEGPAFYPYLSGRTTCACSPGTRVVAGRQVDVVLDLVGLTGRASDRYAKYSLGMKQRLGVAAALLKDPRLLILDEPTNGLDPAGMADMRTMVRRLGAAGCTVLVSSHLLPGPNAGALAAALGSTPDTPGVDSLVDGGQAALVIAAYLVGFLVAGALLLHRRDIL